MSDIGLDYDPVVPCLKYFDAVEASQVKSRVVPG